MSIVFFDGHWRRMAENRLIGKKLFRFERLLSRMVISNRLEYHVVLAVHFVKIPSEPDCIKVFV